MENITICNILDRFGCTELGCVVLKNLKKLGCMFISGVYGTQKLKIAKGVRLFKGVRLLKTQ